MLEKEKGMQIKVLKSHGGGVYFSKELSDYLKEYETQRKKSFKSIPQLNGVAKRKNGHIAEVARDLLDEKKTCKFFWAKVVATTMYIMNRIPTTTIHGMMLEEKYIGRN